MVDFKISMQSPDGTLEGTSLHKFNSTVVDLSNEMHREPNPGPLLEGWMKDAGFEDVTVKRCPLPLGSWARDKHLASFLKLPSTPSFQAPHTNLPPRKNRKK